MDNDPVIATTNRIEAFAMVFFLTFIIAAVMFLIYTIVSALVTPGAFTQTLYQLYDPWPVRALYGLGLMFLSTFLVFLVALAIRDRRYRWLERQRKKESDYAQYPDPE